MAKMRAGKKLFRQLLRQPDWKNHLDEIAAGGMTSVGPLFSMLLLDPLTMHRAAAALGLTIARIAEIEPESARNVVRRFMWHMNEESGNIGWGIPDAFAETLAASPLLAPTYASILISYIMDLGHDDNYCDNDVLRRSCYWAVGRFAMANPNLAEKSRPWLLHGLADADSPCRGYAAWALGKLPPNLMDAPALRKLAQSGNDDICEIYELGEIHPATVSNLAAQTLAASI